MDAGKLTLRLHHIDPVSVVEESIARIQSEHPDRTFAFAPPNGLPHIRADEGRVVQIVTNLLSNAAKYASSGSPITVGIDAVRDAVLFTVLNEGSGISPEDREKLFT